MIYALGAEILQFENCFAINFKCRAGGKPSTWLPPEGRVEKEKTQLWRALEPLKYFLSIPRLILKPLEKFQKFSKNHDFLATLVQNFGH